jgi:hypothetical protein
MLVSRTLNDLHEACGLAPAASRQPSGDGSSAGLASTVRPSFFLSAPEMAPRMVCLCQCARRQGGDLSHLAMTRGVEGPALHLP